MGTVFKRPGRRAWHYKVRLANGVWQQRVGYTDKRATEEKQAREQREIDRGEVGLVDPYRATRKTKIAALVDVYAKDLRARGRADRYVAGVEQRLALVLQVTGKRFLPELDMQVVETFLGQLVRGEDLPDRPAPPNVEDSVPRRAASVRTRDGYVEALRAFGSWLHSSDRWGSNPFGRLRMEARESDRTMQHRALSREQIEQLVGAAEGRGVQLWVRGGKTGGGHAAPDQAQLAALEEAGRARGSLYLFAAWTGLRLNECRQLRRGHVVLDGDEPYVLVHAKYAKARTEKRVPLIAPLVDRLRAHLRERAAAAVRAGQPVPDATTPVFTLPRNLLKQLRADAAFAGLGLYDDAGRKLTFHGLRASTATLLARAGVSVATAMRVLRHADANLTIAIYAKLGLSDLHRELREKLSPQVSPNAMPLRAAVGHAVPLDRSGSALVRSAEAGTPGRVVPLGADRGRAEPGIADEAKMVGRAGVEPACPTGPKADAIAGSGPRWGAVTTGVTKDCGEATGGPDSADPDPLIRALAHAARALLDAGGRPLPAAVRGDLRLLLDGATQ